MEWINIKDKLPNFDEHVLVYIPGFLVQRTERGNPVFDIATHWMPLPKPPETIKKGK